jgi:hypothetical protein
VLPGKDLRDLPAEGGAESGAARSGTGLHGDATDPGLARVVEAWPGLPEHIKAAVLALVTSAR